MPRYWLVSFIKRIYGYPFEGKRYDCRNKLGFLEGTIALALENPEFIGLAREILKTLMD
jgi:UTP--glucose-1-phosphate uridylyltransferase